jgi:hypothetical protein
MSTLCLPLRFMLMLMPPFMPFMPHWLPFMPPFMHMSTFLLYAYATDVYLYAYAPKLQ